MNKTPRIFLAALIAVGVSAEAQTTGSGSPSVRLMASVLACLTPELERSLAAT